MTVEYRITNLEKAVNPTEDTREPLLLKFLGSENDDPSNIVGILYIYNVAPATTYNLNRRQLAKYEASEHNYSLKTWLDSPPQPKQTIRESQPGNRSSDFREESP
jgi:hypothetical protein